MEVALRAAGPPNVEIWFHSVSCQTYPVPCVMVLNVLSVAVFFPQTQPMCSGVLTILSPPDSIVSYHGTL